MNLTRNALLAAIVITLGCGRKPPPEQAVLPPIQPQPPSPIACPEGTKLSGGQPPVASELYCIAVSPTGLVWREGPAVTFHPDGSKAALGQYQQDKKTGYWQTWAADGTLATQGSYDNNVKVGVWTELWPSGAKKSEGSMQSGVPEGQWTWWHANGQIQTQGMMLAGERDGAWVEFDATGKAIIERQYRGGRLITHRAL